MAKHFHDGSPIHINLEASKIEDILYVILPHNSRGTFKIICKPNYDIDKVKEFINNTMLLGYHYEVIVEENYDLIKSKNKEAD